MAYKSIPIYFHYKTSAFYFPERGSLKRFLSKTLSAKSKQIEHLNYIFCDDSYLVKINQEYLKHDTLTDIITFELSERNQPILADIYISVERVKENASKFGESFIWELRRVILHGVLHLCGYQDKSPIQRKKMRETENQYLLIYKSNYLPAD